MRRTATKPAKKIQLAHHLSLIRTRSPSDEYWGRSMPFSKQIVRPPAGLSTRSGWWRPDPAERSRSEGCRWSRIARFPTTRGRSTRCWWPEHPTTPSPIPHGFPHLVATPAPRARRYGSVCTGAFFLGAAGLLDGKSATTHWQHAAELAERFPGARVVPDEIYVEDGALYTSAGVTAGIDLALKLIEDDHGRDLALTVARRLVVFRSVPAANRSSAPIWLRRSPTRARFDPCTLDPRSTPARPEPGGIGKSGRDHVRQLTRVFQGENVQRPRTLSKWRGSMRRGGSSRRVKCLATRGVALRLCQPEYDGAGFSAKNWHRPKRLPGAISTLTHLRGVSVRRKGLQFKEVGRCGPHCAPLGHAVIFLD